MNEVVFVRDGLDHVRLAVGDILIIEADDNRTHVHAVRRSYTVPRMLKEVLDTVGDKRIQRIHRCHAVNLERVQAVSENGLQLGQRWLPIGRSYRQEVMKLLRLL